MPKSISRQKESILLTLLVTLAYLPFLNFRVLRMAGDEKVYVSQSIEMARAGRWFVQTLADVPDYYKGPLHYVLVRMGMLVFGPHLIAGVYMNWLLALAAALALYFMGRRVWSEGKALLFGLAVALNVGVFSHALASQMEVELCAVYGLAVAALGIEALKPISARPNARTDFFRDLPFWVCAGVAGWIKSPIHSLLLGLGGVFFWFLTGTLFTRLKRPGAWLATLSGIALCVAGYAPAYLLDGENFSRVFLGRENMDKPDNGRHVDYVLRSLPHFLFPWTAFVLVAMVMSLWRFLKNWRGAGALIHHNLKGTTQTKAKTMLLYLGWAVALPTIVFFCAFPYKGQNYNLPAIAALILIGFAEFAEVPRWSWKFAGVAVFTLGTMLATALVHLFWQQGLPTWWPAWTVVGALAFLVTAAAGFLVFYEHRSLAASCCALFLGFGLAIAPVGMREMTGARQFVRAHPGHVLHYYNLEPTIWSEWGLLELVLHKRVQGLHRAEQLHDIVKPGHALFVPGAEALGKLQEHARAAGVDISHLKSTPWPRWRTKGMDADGKPLWKSAWAKRDIKVLERDFYILWAE